MTRFMMPFPNEEAQELWSVLVPNAKKAWIGISHEPNWESRGAANLIRPNWFDASKFEVFLKFNVRVVAMLEQLRDANWDYGLRKKLRGLLQREFLVFQDECVCEACDAFTVFWSKHPEYRGSYVYEGFRFTGREVEWDEQDYAVPVLTEEQKGVITTRRRRSENLFLSILPAVADWCMANFSQERDEWIYVNVVPVDIGSYEPADIKKLSPKVEQRRQKREEGKVVESAAMQQNRRALAAMRRRGKLDQDVEDMLNS